MSPLQAVSAVGELVPVRLHSGPLDAEAAHPARDTTAGTHAVHCLVPVRLHSEPLDAEAAHPARDTTAGTHAVHCLVHTASRTVAVT